MKFIDTFFFSIKVLHGYPLILFNEITVHYIALQPAQ